MEPRILQKRIGCRGTVKGRDVIIFSSNDYLGLSSHPDVVEAAEEAAQKYGIGTGGAPGTTGTTDLHKELSQKIAAFKSREKAILFPSGYQANMAVHSALAASETVFFLDKRHHPSAVDGARLGGKSKVFKFDHSDLADLEKSLKTNGGKTNVVSLPSVFTVDGDIAPLDKIAALKKEYDFILILDEAHATGCLGRTGRGLEEYFNLQGASDFIMGSFSKALGSQGGFITYNNASAKLLKSGFRQFSYSTSLSTVCVAAALKALELLLSDKGLYSSLQKVKAVIIERCRESKIQIIAHESMILLIPCENLTEAIERLFEDGFFVVPAEAYINNSRSDCLRITPMSLHTDNNIRAFVDSLRKIIIQRS